VFVRSPGRPESSSIGRKAFRVPGKTSIRNDAARSARLPDSQRDDFSLNLAAHRVGRTRLGLGREYVAGACVLRKRSCSRDRITKRQRSARWLLRIHGAASGRFCTPDRRTRQSDRRSPTVLDFDSGGGSLHDFRRPLLHIDERGSGLVGRKKGEKRTRVKGDSADTLSLRRRRCTTLPRVAQRTLGKWHKSRILTAKRSHKFGSSQRNTDISPELCNRFAVKSWERHRCPGCAARPWAVMFNAFGVRTRDRQGDAGYLQAPAVVPSRFAAHLVLVSRNSFGRSSVCLHYSFKSCSGD
jgi:hypothetical protein